MLKTTKDCSPNKVLNPVSNRCVLVSGRVGRQITNERRLVTDVHQNKNVGKMSQPHVRQSMSGTEMPPLLHAYLDRSSNPHTSFSQASSRLEENDLQTWVTQGWLDVAYVPSPKSMGVLEKQQEAHEAAKHTHSVAVYTVFEGLSITNDMLAFLRSPVFKGPYGERGFRGIKSDVPQQFLKHVTSHGSGDGEYDYVKMNVYYMGLRQRFLLHVDGKVPDVVFSNSY